VRHSQFNRFAHAGLNLINPFCGTYRFCSVVGSHAAVMRCRRRLAHDVAQAQERDALRLASVDVLPEAPDLAMCKAYVRHIGDPSTFHALPVGRRTLGIFAKLRLVLAL